jgi:hypothetical protein
MGPAHEEKDFYIFPRPFPYNAEMENNCEKILRYRRKL